MKLNKLTHYTAVVVVVVVVVVAIHHLELSSMGDSNLINPSNSFSAPFEPI